MCLAVSNWNNGWMQKQALLFKSKVASCDTLNLRIPVQSSTLESKQMFCCNTGESRAKQQGCLSAVFGERSGAFCILMDALWNTADSVYHHWKTTLRQQLRLRGSAVKHNSPTSCFVLIKNMNKRALLFFTSSFMSSDNRESARSEYRMNYKLKRRTFPLIVPPFLFLITLGYKFERATVISWLLPPHTQYHINILKTVINLSAIFSLKHQF